MPHPAPTGWWRVIGWCVGGYLLALGAGIVYARSLIAAGEWTDTGSIPFWVKVSCAVAIALGTYLGGWRIIRTMGRGLVDITPPQGTAAQSASAVVILASSHLGFALSTTHVATGAIIGSGVTRPGARVRWSVAGRLVAAWLITLPSAGVVGALMWWIGHLIGGFGGALAVFVLLLLVAGAVYLRSRRAPVDHHNVNDEWDVAPPADRVPAGTAS